ncbi:hypothetical protein DSL92_07890 [Billgrantia gudaonensis]|uniref:Uncharacterized protein n=1 Tax=Billgrantia gudaonensis TaxID=376427 RepID=A0A3S0QFM3_9GAMM|nr:hypothetical protein DSL92_07890 [Halomonas gudaonensis]
MFDADGQRLGVLLFSLDWHYLTAGLRHAVHRHQRPAHHARCPGELAAERYCRFAVRHRFQPDHPSIPGSHRQREQGRVAFGDHRIPFHTVDIRHLEHRGLAGMMPACRTIIPGGWGGNAQTRPRHAARRRYRP